MDVVFVVWAAAGFAILCCGLYDLQKILATLKWLSGQEQHPPAAGEDDPFIFILLPVLREQRLLAETLNAFTKLQYPLHRLRIFVITTEKETVQQQAAKIKLLSLAHDIASRRWSESRLLEKYLGVFPEDALKKMLAAAGRMEKETDMYGFLLRAFEAYPTTIDLVRKNVPLLNAQAGMALFTHLHYPSGDGNMAQQLAYGCEQLPRYLADVKASPSNTYLAVYNADSRPHADTLRCAAELSRAYRALFHSCPPVLQQSAVYLENMGSAEVSIKNLLLQCAGLLQTRFVLSHELPRLRRQSQSALRFKLGTLRLFQRLLGSEFALCVGHGLFIRYDYVERLNNFSLSAYSDDLLWSFRLCIEHVPILPLPLLEAAESPVTLSSLLAQKKNWFRGYTEYFQSRTAALREGASKRSTIEFVTFHGLIRAAKWLLLSPTIFLAFALPIPEHSWQMFLAALALFALYGFLTFSVILVKLETLKGRSGGCWSPLSFSWCHKVCLVLASLPALLLESLGPWWCLFAWSRSLFTGVPVQKQKTER
jgi:hypothetical protein